MSTQPAKAVDQAAVAAQAPPPATAPPAAAPAATEEDPTIGRIQVSAQRRRRFYVFVARRQFASRPECKQVVITALGSAIAAAISTAGELEESKVGIIVKVQTFYAPIHPGGNRNVSRIAITLERNPDWKPDESDTQRPRQRKEPAAAGQAEEKKSEAAPAAAATPAPAAAAATTPAPASGSAAPAETGQPKAQ
eukprot:Protomagalhaensia_wolfi_Nauph_80__999@NODE_1577_length_1458_cov_132_101480_g1222_i0_p1_GENE_NODE_1577_length_1458_cov_132_101480_g1222_i0NODE_1577_length_1458_cov_132_101480_g1222_i0_p1_ORF_typecomplete_len194_score37_40Alba/PF01918_21/6_2e06Rpp20/PF12328_8/0_0013Rpp20/PF12328_8/5_1e03_NODE_1577_length_1458_cov_132_101480_g1222_i07701351